MKKLSNSGISSLLMIMVVAGSIILLIASMGNMFQSLNKTTSQLKTHGTHVGVLMDMAQMISQAYTKARATSSTIPPGCGGTSTAYLVGGTGSLYLCLPSSYCSQNGTRFCMKSPPLITQHKGSETKEVYVVKSLRQNQNRRIEDLLLPRAFATPPMPGLPDIAATTPPSTSIAVPVCDNFTGVQRDCIRCDAPNQNAYCFKVRICTNSSGTCPSVNDYIEPVFAITYL